ETKSVDGDVQFLYRLIERGASQSFGIYVAKLAGLPEPLLKRASTVLQSLESHEEMTSQKKNTQLSFFEDEPVVQIPTHLKRLEKDLAKIDVMRMTPLEALSKLHELKMNYEDSKSLS